MMDGIDSNHVNWHRLLPLLVAALSVLAYANSFSGAFVFDDHTLLLRLQHADRVPHPLVTLFMESERPVADLSFYANFMTGGLNSADYHMTNLIVHVFSALLLYGIVRRTLLLQAFEGRFEGSASGIAFASSALWACHPLTTSAVTYVCQRYESMMAMFYLLTLYSVLRGVLSPNRNVAWYAVGILACLLGVGCKEVMVTAPIAVFFYDWVFLSKGEGSMKESMARRWWFYAGIAAVWPALVVLSHARSDMDPSASYALTYIWKGTSSLSYAVTQPGVVLHYLRLAVWPAGLCFDYGWVFADKPADFLLSGSVVVMMVVVTLMAVLRRYSWGYPLAWFFIILAPTSSAFPRPDLIAEHRMYLPLAGVAVLAVIGVHHVTGIMGRRCSISLSLLNTVRLLLLVGVVCGLATTTIYRNSTYKSDEAVWQDVIKKRPNNLRAHLNLSCSLLDQGRFGEVTLVCSNVLVRLQDSSGMTSRSIPEQPADAKSARLYINARYYAHAHNYMGVACAKSGQLAEAVDHFQEAVRILPQFVTAECNLAQAIAERDRASKGTDSNEGSTNYAVGQ
jgi:protein O-mannosyl-transferase